jgi:hypothetical protein
LERITTGFAAAGNYAGNPHQRQNASNSADLSPSLWEEPAQIFDSYSSDTLPTATRQPLVTAPTTQNLAQVLATLIADFRARGVKRTGPT